MSKYSTKQLKKSKIVIFFTTFLLLVVCFGFHYNWFGHHFILCKKDFKSLPGWGNDKHRQALTTLQKSCVAIVKLDPHTPFSASISQSGTTADWQKICLAIDKDAIKDDISARKFFESWFVPYRVYDNFKAEGLFTGYYLPTLKCSLKPNKHYKTPIYALPDDLVTVDLGIFDNKLQGKKIVGQLKNKQLYPYPTRADITNNLNNPTKVLVWCDSPVDVFFMQIQGSGMAQLPNKKKFLIGYAGTNGHPYTSIRKILIQNKELTEQNSSMQDMRAWFARNPEKIESILNLNSSYVFFRILENKDPLGAQAIPLTTQRSLAVDRQYIPLGTPVWLDTVVPKNAQESLASFQHLLIAQDTGGAIKGIVRGDMYWGGEPKAAFIAGHMKSPGSYWILLPRFK